MSNLKKRQLRGAKVVPVLCLPGRKGIEPIESYETLPETNSLHLKQEGWKMGFMKGLFEKGLLLAVTQPAKQPAIAIFCQENRASGRGEG